MAGPRSPFPIRYLDEAIGFLVPRSFIPVVRPLVPSFRSFVPSFRSFVPSFLIHRFITPSPPSRKEASLTLGIIYTIIFNTLVRGMPVLRTRNSLKASCRRSVVSSDRRLLLVSQTGSERRGKAPSRAPGLVPSLCRLW